MALGEEFQLNPAAWGIITREARNASGLDHPCICTIQEVGEENEQPYIAMEYIEGCTLKALITPSGLTPKLVSHPIRQIASALAHAHERGIIHRDITSSNVVITNQGDVKIFDFGLAKRIGPGVWRGASSSNSYLRDLGRMAEPLHYLAPEILLGERANVWSDIWSLGVLLYEMATGMFPFHGETVAGLSTAIMTLDPAPPPKKIAVWIAQVIARCLQRDRACRYHCARDIATDLPAERMAECLDLALELDRLHSRPSRAAVLAAVAA